MGYIGKQPVVDVLLKGLKRLEYRGYDSAGVAYFHQGRIEIRKSEGKLANVQQVLAKDSPVEAYCGLGHTRWATHGRPTTQNAHPHRTGSVVLVHNGIIENYLEIKKDIEAAGYRPMSETDSELFGYLILEEQKKGESFTQAVRKAFLKLEGSCSVVVMSEEEPGVIVGIRNGSPLAIAKNPKDGSMILASDAQPLLDYSQDVFFLENGDMVVVRQGGYEFFDFQTGEKIKRDSVHLDWSADQLEKQGFEHFMQKEIFEQPQAWVDTLNALLDRASSTPFALAEQPATKILRGAKELILISAGTSSHAAILAKYWIESLAKIPVTVELSSEFRYRQPVIRPGAVVVGVSQSGETADTLSVIREMKRLKIPTLGLTNVRGSTLSREADATFFTAAGPEIGVAATKTFTSQLLAMLLWAGDLARDRGAMSKEDLVELYDQVLRLPHLFQHALEPQSDFVSQVRAVAQEIYQKKGFFFIGRGYSFPLALEGALKLKEIAYIHAEGYAGGELKHGPIAMIDEEMVLVALCPRDVWREKTLSNLQEVKARGATILGVGNPTDGELRAQSNHWIPIPLPASLERALSPLFMPFYLSVVVQLLSYEIAVKKGTNVDQPRNLAKSVTVE